MPDYFQIKLYLTSAPAPSAYNAVPQLLMVEFSNGALFHPQPCIDKYCCDPSPMISLL